MSMMTLFARGALFLYDIFLTLHREARQIWTRRHAVTTVIYTVARYSTILSHLIVLLIGTRWSGQNSQVHADL